MNDMPPRRRLPTAVTTALLWIGYGCFHLFGYGGTFRAAHLSGILANQGQVLASQLLFLAATGAGCLLLRAVQRRAALPTLAAGGACYVALATFFAWEHVARSADAATIYLLSLLDGLAASYPLLFWFEQFLAVYQERGRARCITAIAGGMLLNTVASPVPAIARADGAGALALLLAVVALSGLCLVMLAALGQDNGAARPHPAKGERYRLTTYSIATLISFGTTWGLSVFVSLAPVGDAGTADSVPSLAMTGAATCCIIIGSIAATKERGGVKFGLLIRLSIACAGVVFGVTPLLSELAPWSIGPLSKAVGIALGIAMTFFSVEVCHESGLRICTVMPVNYALFVVAACVAAGVSQEVFAAATGHVAWDAVAALAIVATMGAIPFFPSTGSDATMFTLKELPENEGYEAHVAKLRESLAAKYRLTPRETDVLELLLAGKTRQEIAEKLSLSNWTVKEHTSNIYGKMGIHSYKELVTLAAGRETRGE